jgi:molybdate transport system regulatory protein
MPVARAPTAKATGTTGGRKSAPAKPLVKLRIRVTKGDVIAVGPGKVALLEAIDSTGSISAAAKHLGMSYRRAWLLLDEMNTALKHPAVDSATGGQHGGGSVVTAAGHELIALYRRIETTAARACEDDLRALLSKMAR